MRRWALCACVALRYIIQAGCFSSDGVSGALHLVARLLSPVFVVRRAAPVMRCCLAAAVDICNGLSGVTVPGVVLRMLRLFVYPFSKAPSHFLFWKSSLSRKSARSRRFGPSSVSPSSAQFDLQFIRPINLWWHNINISLFTSLSKLNFPPEAHALSDACTRLPLQFFSAFRVHAARYFLRTLDPFFATPEMSHQPFYQVICEGGSFKSIVRPEREQSEPPSPWG